MEQTRQQQQQQRQGRDIPVQSHWAGKEEAELKKEQPYTTEQQQKQQQQPITSMRREEETGAMSDVPVGEQVRSGDLKSQSEWSREQAQLEKDQPQYEREQPAGIKGTEHGERVSEQPSVAQGKETEYGRGQGGGVLSELTPAQQEEHKLSQSQSRGESGSGGVSGVSQHQASAMRVFDAAGGVVLSLTEDDVNNHNIGWLRHRLHQRIPATHLATGEPDVSEMHIFVHYGDWLEDNVTLKSIHGDRMYVKCYRPHGNTSFNLNFKVVPSIESDRILTVQVKDNDTIEQVKDRITEMTRVPAISQRIIFCDKELDDARTVTSYKLPAEATCELRLSAIE
jgi:hypothetical protein